MKLVQCLTIILLPFLLASCCSYYIQVDAISGKADLKKSLFPRKDISLTIDSVYVEGFSPSNKACLTGANLEYLRKEIPRKFKRYSADISTPQDLTYGDKCDGLYQIKFNKLSGASINIAFTYFIKIGDAIITNFSGKKISKHDILPLCNTYNEQDIDEIVKKFNQGLINRGKRPAKIHDDSYRLQ